jgi:predicted nucleotidyltransferase
MPTGILSQRGRRIRVGCFKHRIAHGVAYSNRDMTLDEVRSRYRNQIVAAASSRGAHNVRIFGSVARGDQRHDSDIDFLVDFEPGRSLLDLTGLLLDLERVLGCKVDVVSGRGLKPRLATEVMREAVLL